MCITFIRNTIVGISKGLSLKHFYTPFELPTSIGHCFTLDDTNNPAWNKIILGFGVDKFSEFDDSFLNNVAKKIQKRTIENIIFHNEYEYPHIYYDIVIVKLSEPVELNDNAFPICIPNSADPNPNTMALQTATIIGYGPDTNGSETLNEFWSTIKKKGFCAFRYNPENTNFPELKQKIKATLPKKFRNNLLCATSQSNRGTCKGKDYFMLH